MNDLAHWLDSLELPQYLDLFSKHDIDIAVLPHLTDQDLKDIGISLGHRRKILGAIAEHRNPDAVIAADSSAATMASASLSWRLQSTAERRLLTVMFCDLVGSTALANELDPEDIREIMGAYHSCCASLIKRHGGFVAKYMGDGVLAYFGYPSAHEHDAERAVNAGLALVQAMPELVTAANAPLRVRVGIATGVVVVGDLLGVGESQERGIVGDTPNLAARLQAIAAPNAVIIADSTRKLLGDLFELSDLGSIELKGMPAPLRAWSALRPNANVSRFEALNATGLSPLVGREGECELLLRAWSRVKAGNGLVVLLSGEAGIGKSRLVATFLGCVADDHHHRLRYYCSPQHSDSAFYPIIKHLEQAAGFTNEDTSKSKRNKLDAMLARSSTSIEHINLVADLMSLSDASNRSSTTAPQEWRQKLMDALLAQIEQLAHAGPVLMIFEDAHWADPTSLALLALLIDRIERLRILLFVTCRPGFQPPWADRPQVAPITINRLTSDQACDLIEGIMAGNNLKVEEKQDIIERADGIPLFVEEITKAALEARLEREAGRTLSSPRSPASAVPTSLHASLLARLDRLGEAKIVAQIGAVIGREFSHALLARVAEEAHMVLEPAIDRLISAGLLTRQGVPPHATYLFNHALIRDAAYGTLLREPRRALHLRVAEALSIRSPDVEKVRPEILARHYTEAALIEKAALLWGEAGQQSLARSALVEAETQLTRALGQIASLTATPALRRQQLKLQLDLANVLIHTRGYAAVETRSAFDKAGAMITLMEESGEASQDNAAHLKVLYGVWSANLIAFHGDNLDLLSNQFLKLASIQKETGSLVVGHRLMGMYLLHVGKPEEAREHFDRAARVYDPHIHSSLVSHFGQDPGVPIFGYRALARWNLGYPDAARKDAQHALTSAREIGHTPTLMYALNVTTAVLLRRGEFGTAYTQAAELTSLGKEKAAPFWEACGNALCVLIHALKSECSISIAPMSAAIASYRATRASVLTPFFMPIFAKVHAVLGLFDEAWRLIEEAMMAEQQSGELWCASEVRRLAGETALLCPGRELLAHPYYEQALEISRSQKARSLELRAATSLARLHRDQGKLRQARNILEPVYSWFSEGFDTIDLQSAQALLTELN